MKISKKIFEEIVNTVPYSPFETGGFLGGKSDTVLKVVYDCKKSNFASYQPNNNLLNSSLSEWQQNEIDFLGIFHTHYPSCTSLSACDEEYIKEIMQNLKGEISVLYFPIVIAKKEMCVYKAEFKASKLSIKPDKLTLLR